MEEINIELLVARVKEKFLEFHSRIIYNNGKLERFCSTLKTEPVRKTAYFGYEDIKMKMTQWIYFYNNECLLCSLLYLITENCFAGRKEERLEDRKNKLYNADIKRLVV